MGGGGQPLCFPGDMLCPLVPQPVHQTGTGWARRLDGQLRLAWA